MAFLKDKIEIGVMEAELGAKNTFTGFSPKIKFFIILFVVGSIPAFFITKFAINKSFYANYNQTPITAKPSFVSAKEPKRGDIIVIRLPDGAYSAIMKISNLNLDLSVQNAPYTVTFLNSAKQRVYSFSGKLFLQPDQSKHIVIPRFTSPEPIAFQDFKFTQELNWQKRLNIPQINITSAEPEKIEQQTPLSFIAQGDFTNHSPYTLKEVALNFLLFDSSGNIVGVSQRVERTVKPGERRGYVQPWPGMSKEKIAEVVVEVDTNSLDPSNLIVTGSGKAGELNR